MKIFHECIPCAVKQMIDAGRMASDSTEVREKILRKALSILQDVPFDRSPPHMAMHLHAMVRNVTGNNDPYAGIRKRYNDIALACAEDTRIVVDIIHSSFENAVKLAISGNVIDFGIADPGIDIDVSTVIEETLDQSLAKNDAAELEQKIKKASNVLYLGDNAGEIVFDKIFIENFIHCKTTYAVKSEPIINDSLMEDARYVGMPDTADVIENGAVPPAPGTILENTSDDFIRVYESADVVISKGQGNYETLFDTDREIFFLLKAKCPVIARDIGCSVGDIICMKN